MKKFLALFVVVMLLVAAGSAFAAHGPTGGDDPYSGDGSSGNNNNNGNNGNNGENGNGETPAPTPGGASVPAGAITTAPAVIAVFGGGNSPAFAALIAVLQALGGNIPEGAALLSNADIQTGEQLTASAAQALLATLANLFQNIANATIALRFPSMRSATPGVAVFGGAAIATQIAPWRGRRLSMLMIPKGRAGGASFSAADEDDVQQGTFIDAEGNAIEGDLPEDGDISIAAYMEGGVEYDPIAVEGELEPAEEPTDDPSNGGDEPSNGGDEPGDEPSNGGDEPSNSTNDPGSSGGGCSAGTSALALAVLGAFIARKR